MTASDLHAGAQCRHGADAPSTRGDGRLADTSGTFLASDLDEDANPESARGAPYVGSNPFRPLICALGG